MEELKRKSFNKATREIVLAKYEEHCSYCGCLLTLKSMQVDHLHPFSRSHFENDLDPNRIENLMPSCRKCNGFKGAFRLEDYRYELQLQVERLAKNAQFMRAVTFGQVKITESPIVFYFEIAKEK